MPNVNAKVLLDDPFRCGFLYQFFGFEPRDEEGFIAGIYRTSRGAGELVTHNHRLVYVNDKEQCVWWEREPSR